MQQRKAPRRGCLPAWVRGAKGRCQLRAPGGEAPVRLWPEPDSASPGRTDGRTEGTCREGAEDGEQTHRGLPALPSLGLEPTGSQPAGDRTRAEPRAGVEAGLEGQRLRFRWERPRSRPAGRSLHAGPRWGRVGRAGGRPSPRGRTPFLSFPCQLPIDLFTLGFVCFFEPRRRL